MASQFHPEFKSRPERPHPLFDGFVKAALATADGTSHEHHEPTPVHAEPESTAETAPAG